MSSEPNKERLKLWADALRSGEYAQTRNALMGAIEWQPDGNVSQVGYCCLGVACEVAVKNGLVLDYDVYEGDHGTMPEAVAEWFGFKYYPDGPDSWNWSRTDKGRYEFNPALATEGEVHEGDEDYDGAFSSSGVTASELNDDHGFDFYQIADVIDKKWNLRDVEG